jgi:hypothetical protein
LWIKAIGVGGLRCADLVRSEEIGGKKLIQKKRRTKEGSKKNHKNNRKKSKKTRRKEDLREVSEKSVLDRRELALERAGLGENSSWGDR